MKTTLSAVFTVVILLLSQLHVALQAPVGSSAPISIAQGSKKRPRRQSVRPKLPLDLDVSKVNLRQLVDMRPAAVDTPDGRRYRQYFMDHPRVKAINLHDTKTAKTAHELHELSKGGGGDDAKDDVFFGSSNKKLTASIHNLVEDTAFDDGARYKDLKEAIQVTRHRSLKQDSVKRYTAKLTREQQMARDRAAKYKYKEKHGHFHEATVRMARTENPLINLPLILHLDPYGKRGNGLTAKQAEEEARGLSRFYSSENILTRELGRYLDVKKATPEERVVVLGLRQRHLTAQAEARKAADGKKSAASSALLLAGASGSGITNGAASTSTPTGAVLVPHSHPDHSLVPPAEVTADDWAWFHEYVDGQ
jgi:hypothetical protein